MARFALITIATFSFLALSATAMAGTGTRDRLAVDAVAKQLAAAPVGSPAGVSTSRVTRSGSRMGPTDIAIGNPNCRTTTDRSGYYCVISQYWTLPNWWTSELAVFNWNNVIVGWIICYTGNSGYGQTYCYPR